MAAKNHVLMATLLGSLFLVTPTHAIEIDETVSFLAQQSGAPGSFSLYLQDFYRTFPTETVLKQSVIGIYNLSPDSFITSLFIYDPGGIISGGGLGGVGFVGFGLLHAPVPASIGDAIAPQNSYIVDDPGCGPGQYVQWAADGSRMSVIDAFNAGALKLGIELSDGHTYIVAIPDGGKTSLLFMAGIAVMAFTKLVIAPKS